MKKKSKIILLLMLIILFSAVAIPVISNASEVYDEQYEGLYGDNDTYVKQNIVGQDMENKLKKREVGSVLGNMDKNNESEAGSTKFSSMVNKILSVVRTIGILISVITLAVIGIKYMVGSVEEKAEYKKTMIPYLIGVFLIFSFTTFPQLIYNIVTSME